VVEFKVRVERSGGRISVIEARAEKTATEATVSARMYPKWLMVKATPGDRVGYGVLFFRAMIHAEKAGRNEYGLRRVRAFLNQVEWAAEDGEEVTAEIRAAIA
jgi:hypothetical protein